MKHCCRVCCCAIFCCTCCRKTALDNINLETKLLPKNEHTRNELELDELTVYGSAPAELRKILLETYGRKPIKKIICGKSHCLLLFNNNNLYGFGSNEYGQLGLPIETKICNKITKISLNFGDLENFEIIDIAAGDEFSLILLKNNNNQNKLIRFGTLKKYKYIPMKNKINTQSIEILPDTINNNNYINQIKAFEKKIIFYTSNNDIYLGGMDFDGCELDTYTYLEKFPTKIKDIHLLSGCCILINENNQLFGFGDNSYNELGQKYNNNLYNIKFQLLHYGFPPNEIKKICTGARHIMFLFENGELYCIGDNSEGQCCCATNSCVRLNKIEINNKQKIIDCYCGYDHNLIILQNGSVYTWGSATAGKLGYFDEKFYTDIPKEITEMKIKCINNVYLGYNLTIIATGKQEDSIANKFKDNEKSDNVL